MRFKQTVSLMRFHEEREGLVCVLVPPGHVSADNHRTEDFKAPRFTGMWLPWRFTAAE